MAILEGFELLQRLPADSSATLEAQVVIAGCRPDIFQSTYQRIEE